MMNLHFVNRGCHGSKDGCGAKEHEGRRWERFGGWAHGFRGGREGGGHGGHGGHGFGPGFGGGFGHGRGRGFGRGFGEGEMGRMGALRMFASGDLRFVILQMLADGPSHGYELIKAVGERMGGQYQPSPGVIYPMLTMLEEMGHATVTTEGTRKLYAITDEGRKALAENKQAVDAIFARMDQVRTEQATSGRGQIERAMLNLKMALRMRGESLTTEQIHGITDIIDAAAKQIERMNG